jgi:methionyl-tRNA synthetase
MANASGLFTQLSAQFGISIWIIIVIVIWSIIWKLIALWKSARKGHIAWFIILAIVNTVGILEILYVYIFSEMDFKKKTPEKRKKRK